MAPGRRTTATPGGAAVPCARAGAGAAYPAGAAAMRRRVQGMLAEITARLDREAVAPAVAALRLEVLALARTPWGLAAHVGRAYDATGDPRAAHQQMLALERVDADAMRAFLMDLQERAPVRSELRP